MTIAVLLLLAAFSGHSDATQTPDSSLQIPKPAAPPPRTLIPSWEVPVPGTAVPLLVGMDTAFAVATREGRITGHRLDTGERLWEVDLESPLAAPPLFIEGRLAVPVAKTNGATTEIALLEPLTGIASSRITLEPAPVNPALAAVRAGLAVTGLFEAKPGLRLYDAGTGALLWSTELASPASAPVAQCTETILVGGADGLLTALSSKDGSPQWTRKLAGAVTTPVVCDGSRAWVGSADNQIHALKMGRRRCRHLWSYPTGGDIAGRLVLFDQRVSFFSYDTYLYSLSAHNGHLQWKVRLGRRPQADSVLVGGILVLAQLNTERMELFSLADGGQTAALTLSPGTERFVTPPARAGRMVLIAAARYGEESARVIGVAPLAEPAAGTPVSQLR